MASNPFGGQNPFGGGAPGKTEKPDARKAASTPYQTTGESSRDHVRKTFYEIFNTEADESNAQIVEQLETQIFESSGSNSKSKEYRDMTKSIQLKLRGTRFVEIRSAIRQKKISVEDVCSDDFIKGKTAIPGAKPAQAPAMAQSLGRGRGLPPGGRGRGAPMPPGGMGRGRGMPPMAQKTLGRPPVQAMPTMPNVENANENQHDEKQENQEEAKVQVTPKPPLQEAPAMNDVRPLEKESNKPNEDELEDRPMQIPVKNTQPTQDPPKRVNVVPPRTEVKQEPKQPEPVQELAFDEPSAQPPKPEAQMRSESGPSSSLNETQESYKDDQSTGNELQIHASLDDSMVDESNTSQLRTKKKKKKKKKLQNIDDMPAQPTQKLIDSLENQIKEQEKSESQQPTQVEEEPKSEVETQVVEVSLQEEVEQVKEPEEQLKTIEIEQIHQIQTQEVQEEEKEVPPTYQFKRPASQSSRRSRQSRGLEENKEEEVVEDKTTKLPQAEIGKLTKQNLDSVLKSNDFKLNEDIETESIIVKDQHSETKNRLARPASSLKFKGSEKGSKRNFQTAAIGEQILNNATTVMTRSLTHSQIGAQDSENIRRIQEALQSKKEINMELNQKIMALEQDSIIKNKRFQMMQDENASLKEEIRRLQSENDRQAEQLREQTNESSKRSNELRSQYANLQEENKNLVNEVESLRQERDIYKDRFQRVLRDSQQQREQLERQMDNSSVNQLLQSLRSGAGFNMGSDGSSLINSSLSQNHPSASNQQEINLQKEMAELKTKYEKQLREQRNELVQRTRDLQKVERKNIKYRENNRVLSEAVQGLENRNLSMAGSGGANQDQIIMYEHALRETNEDMIENMEFNDEFDLNLQFDGQNHNRNLDGFDRHSNHNELLSAGLFNQGYEQNSGEQIQPRRVRGTRGGSSGYYENAQDEATTGESHHNNVLEEEKVYSNQQNQQVNDNDNALDQQSQIAQDMQSTNNQNDMEFIMQQNNNQSADQDSRREEQKTTKKQYPQTNYLHSSAVQVVNNEEAKIESQNGQSTDRFKEPTGSENSDEEISGDDESHDSQNEDYRDSQDSQDDVSQDSNEFQDEMQNEISSINQRIPGAGSGNQETHGRSTHTSPAAIQLQKQGRSNGPQASRYNHGNMPHQMQQHNQQYNICSSGAQGMTSSRRGNSNYQDNQDDFEESKHGRGFSGINDMYVSGTGSGGVAGEAGSSNKTQQRRNRRGYRQQNQQPSSGANDRDLNRRPNRNNRQGRQNQELIDAGRGGQNNGNLQNYDDPSQQALNVDNRGRPIRTSNRGRQQNIQQQQPQQIQNREASTNITSSQQSMNQHASQGQSTSLQNEPVSLSQEREQKNNQNRYGAARGQDGSHAVQQVISNLTNYNNQISNAPASSQSQMRVHGAAGHMNQSQSSQMIPASTASHSGGQQQFHQGSISASAPHGGPKKTPGSYTGVVQHAQNNIHFDSGSTSSNNQIINPRSQQNRQNRQVGPIASLSAQASSSPSTQVNFNQRFHSNDQQQNFYPNQAELSGPGAVGAPPSATQTRNIKSAISPPAQHQQENPNQQNISPGSSVNTGQGQAFLGRGNNPTVAQVNNENQQSLNQIFSTGSAGSQEPLQVHLQPPAALGTNQNFAFGGGSGDIQDRGNMAMGQVHTINAGSSLFDDNSQSFPNINFNNMQEGTQQNRNNDSRKTSGANTPSKEGAITPKTQQQHHSGAGNSSEFNSAVTAGLNSHLNSQATNQQNIIHNLTVLGQNPSSRQPQRQGGQASQNNQQQTSALSSVSIIDQLSAAASGREPVPNQALSSLFDDILPNTMNSEMNEEHKQSEDNIQSSLLSGDGGGGSHANVIPNNMFD